MAEYAKRDIEAQGEHYIRHLHAMTAEGLHAKGDIAAELAHRDLRIAELESRGGNSGRENRDPVVQCHAAG